MRSNRPGIWESVCGLQPLVCPQADDLNMGNKVGMVTQRGKKVKVFRKHWLSQGVIQIEDVIALGAS